MPQSVNTARIEVHSFDTVTLKDRQFLTGAKDGKASPIGGEGGELCLLQEQADFQWWCSSMVRPAWER
jgi:hypothetical protein